MTVAGTVVEQQFTNIVVNVPLVVNIQTSGVPAEIVLEYGAHRNTASQGPDYTVVIAPDLMTFTVTPLTALMNKIAADGPNVIYVRRELPLTTDFDYDDAFVREKLVDEFNRVWMVEQQNLFRIGSLQDANDAADAAALSAEQAAASAAAAAASATASAGSATASQNSAGNSAASATQSANSASAASGSATAAAGSATAASGSASAASGSAGAANASAGNAAASASAASGSAGTATTQATNAANSATAAAGSATAAGTSATNAANSATAAQTSATNASGSATAAAASASAILGPPTGRLSLVAATPFFSTDQLAKTNIYWVNFLGSGYPWYNGTTWALRTLAADLILALDPTSAGHTGYHQSGKNFDLFLYNDAGTDRLVSGPAWTSDIVRASAISLLNGFYVNTASMTARFGNAAGNTVTVPAQQGTYVGTFRASANGVTQVKFGGLAVGGSEAWIGIWNMYGRVKWRSNIQDNTSQYTYAVARIPRAFDGSSQMRASFVTGLAIDTVRTECSMVYSQDNTTVYSLGIAKDSTTTTDSATNEFGAAGGSVYTNYTMMIYPPDIGFHYMQLTEANVVYGTASVVYPYDSATLVPWLRGMFLSEGMY